MAEPISVNIEKLAEATLSLIRKRTGRPVAIADLSKKLKCSDDQIRAAARLLKEWRYRVRRTSDKLVFISAPDILSAIEISHGLKTKTIGQKVISFNEVKSTNSLASQIAETGAAHGTIITAEQQTRGRGRLGRNWYSPSGKGIYLSIILRPKFSPDQAPGLSIMTALSLALTVEKILPKKVRIKWPNDLLLGDRKAAGILTELTAERKKIDYIIVGVGININQQSADFPDELRDAATSLRRVARRKINRIELLQNFLVIFEREYERYCRQRLRPVHKQIRRYSSLLDQSVRLAGAGKTIQGVVADIDELGRLVVHEGDKVHYINSGEVTVVRE